MAKPYTPALLAKFDRLRNRLVSRDPVAFGKALLAMAAFVEEHTEKVCDEMHAHLKRRDAKRNSKVRDA